MEIPKELKAKAKACKSAEELVALAKANDIVLTAEEAEFLLQGFAEGEIADNELDNVAGGTDGCVEPSNPYEMVYWNTKEEVQFIFNVGDTVEAFADFNVHHTATCRVTGRMPDKCQKSGKSFWVDYYYLEKVNGSKTAFTDRWVVRNEIEK